MNTYACLLLASLVLHTAKVSRAEDDEKARLDCAMIDKSAADTREKCLSNLCFYEPSKRGIPNTPFCFLDSAQHGYAVNNVKTVADGIEAELNIKPNTKKLSELTNHIDRLKLKVEHLSQKILRLKITDSEKKRYEVPAQEVFHIPASKPASDNDKYKVKLEQENDFKLTISRRESGTHLIDTSIGPMLYTDQFLQIATYLASENLFGFGENFHTKFRHDFNYTTLAIFARDNAPIDVSYF